MQVNAVLSLLRRQKDLVFSFTRRVGPLLFLRELLSNPASAGAPWPSSRHLGAKTAAGIPKGGSGLIVELGAGTGVVTQALLDHGVKPHRLLVIERSPTLFEYLRKCFPELRVVLADA